ncbi:MAG: peptidoglycan-binding domain-containing protein [Candidatus Taylorbacteria bacterium]
MKNNIMIVCALGVFISTNLVVAAATPTLVISNTASSVNIAVTGADHNATVTFNYPNTSVSNPGSVSYTSLDLGQTDSSGSFSVSVAPNSYGLSGGISTYVTVGGSSSSHVAWPISTSTASQVGSLSLSQHSISLVVGQSVSIFPMNTANTVYIQGNSNSSVASAYVQSSNNSVSITGLNVGSSIVSICAPTAGCGAVSVTVTAPTQKITFSQSPIYVIAGQPSQNFSIYGPGTYYGLTNTNKDAISVSIDGTNLILKGLAIGKSTISICADGYSCGSVTVNSLSSGSSIPTQATILAPVTSGFDQPPQISSLTISSNNADGLFFGPSSTISINFGTNVSVTNVQVKIAGVQTLVTQGSNGLYYVSYRSTGNAAMPLSAIASFTDLSGRVGQSYFWIGNSAVNSPTASTVSAVSTSNGHVGVPSQLSGSGSFTKYLYSGISDSEVTILQQRLKAGGFFTGLVTGYFGPQTKAAVGAYQKKNGLAAVGVVGPSTRTLLNKGI